jgi:hypothetical protein
LLPAVKEEIADRRGTVSSEGGDAIDADPNSRRHDGHLRLTAASKQPYLPGAEDIEELDQQADICLTAQDEQQLAKSNFRKRKKR